MANNKACGVVLGINVKGVVPILLHYFMCLFRLNGLKNKFRVMIYLMKGVKNG
jgi:hypothetical protein